MRAALNFEDGPDGTVNVGMWLEGPPDVKSSAHKSAMQLLQHFENHAERLADPVTDTHPLQEIEEGIRSVNPLIIHAGVTH